MPASPRIDVVASNGRALASLDDYRRRAGSLEPALEAAARTMRALAARQFSSAQGWPPAKKRRGKTGVITGRLRASYTQDAGENIARISRSELRGGSAVPYARWFTGGRPRQPRRPVYPPGQRIPVGELRSHIVAWVLDGQASR